MGASGMVKSVWALRGRKGQPALAESLCYGVNTGPSRFEVVFLSIFCRIPPCHFMQNTATDTRLSAKWLR